MQAKFNPLKVKVALSSVGPVSRAPGGTRCGFWIKDAGPNTSSADWSGAAGTLLKVPLRGPHGQTGPPSKREHRPGRSDLKTAAPEGHGDGKNASPGDGKVRF